MQGIVEYTDTTLDDVLNGDKPVFILFSNGSGLRGDFSSAFKKAAIEHPQYGFGQIDPDHNPHSAARFAVGSKAVLVGWHNGQEIVRRSRPWGTDVPLAIEKMQTTLAARSPEAPTNSLTEEQSEQKAVTTHPNNKPVHVTDTTFEAEVLEFSNTMPVIIDYWAEWCGPCKMVAPTLEKLAEDFAGQIRVAKVDVDHNPGLSQAFKIMSIPTIMIVKQRTIVFSQPGALPESAFRDLAQQAIALELPPRVEEESEEPIQE
jgi:thioredoxin